MRFRGGAARCLYKPGSDLSVQLPLVLGRSWPWLAWPGRELRQQGALALSL